MSTEVNQSTLWNWFMADNAPKPHCGLVFARNDFITAPLDHQQLMQDLCKLLNQDRAWSNEGFRSFLKIFLQTECDNPNVYVIHSQSQSDFLGYEQGFWNITEGWGDISEATRFSELEARTRNLPMSKASDAKWIKFAICRNDGLPLRLLIAAKEAYASQVMAKQVTDGENGHLSTDEMIKQLRHALKECFGFVEAWQCHLEDRGGNRKAADTVENVLNNARTVYRHVNDQLCASTMRHTPVGAGLAQGQNVEPVSSSTGLIRSIMMQDIVGPYEDKEDVPEWSWIESNASFSHLHNGQEPVWEFMLNIDLSFQKIPKRLEPVIQQAINDEILYLHFHQGT